MCVQENTKRYWCCPREGLPCTPGAYCQPTSISGSGLSWCKQGDKTQYCCTTSRPDWDAVAKKCYKKVPPTPTFSPSSVPSGKTASYTYNVDLCYIPSYITMFGQKWEVDFNLLNKHISSFGTIEMTATDGTHNASVDLGMWRGTKSGDLTKVSGSYIVNNLIVGKTYKRKITGSGLLGGYYTDLPTITISGNKSELHDLTGRCAKIGEIANNLALQIVSDPSFICNRQPDTCKAFCKTLSPEQQKALVFCSGKKVPVTPFVSPTPFPTVPATGVKFTYNLDLCIAPNSIPVNGENFGIDGKFLSSALGSLGYLEMVPKGGGTTIRRNLDIFSLRDNGNNTSNVHASYVLDGLKLNTTYVRKIIGSSAMSGMYLNLPDMTITKADTVESHNLTGTCYNISQFLQNLIWNDPNFVCKSSPGEWICKELCKVSKDFLWCSASIPTYPMANLSVNLIGASTKATKWMTTISVYNKSEAIAPNLIYTNRYDDQSISKKQSVFDKVPTNGKLYRIEAAVYDNSMNITNRLTNDCQGGFAACELASFRGSVNFNIDSGTATLPAGKTTVHGTITNNCPGFEVNGTIHIYAYDDSPARANKILARSENLRLKTGQSTTYSLTFTPKFDWTHGYWFSQSFPIECTNSIRNEFFNGKFGQDNEMNFEIKPKSSIPKPTTAISACGCTDQNYPGGQMYCNDNCGSKTGLSCRTNAQCQTDVTRPTLTPFLTSTPQISLPPPQIVSQCTISNIEKVVIAGACATCNPLNPFSWGSCGVCVSTLYSNRSCISNAISKYTSTISSCAGAASYLQACTTAIDERNPGRIGEKCGSAGGLLASCITDIKYYKSKPTLTPATSKPTLTPPPIIPATASISINNDVEIPNDEYVANYGWTRMYGSLCPASVALDQIPVDGNHPDCKLSDIQVTKTDDSEYSFHLQGTLSGIPTNNDYILYGRVTGPKSITDWTTIIYKEGTIKEFKPLVADYSVSNEDLAPFAEQSTALLDYPQDPIDLDQNGVSNESDVEFVFENYGSENCDINGDNQCNALDLSIQIGLSRHE